MTRQKSLCRFLDVIGVLLILVAFVSAVEHDPEVKPGTLSELLEFDNRQMDRYADIMEMEQSQATLDRENFKTNTAGLIEAARRRRSMVDEHIEAMLTPEQQEVFEDLKQRRKRQRELFMLTEGLLLTPGQQDQVREILEKYRPGKKGDRPEGFKGREMGMGRPGGGMGRPGGGMMGGGRGGMRPGGRGGDGFRQKMDEMDAKKAKEIKQILSPEQQELFKQVRRIQKAERKLRNQ